MTTWVKYFEREEGIKIDYGTLLRRLQKAGKIGITGRSKINQVLKNAFYAESDVREVVADLLLTIPQADESGFFEKDGVKFGTALAWLKTLAMPKTTIYRRIKNIKEKSIQGKTKQGKISDFYSESDIREACADLLEKRNKSNS